jgi:succinate dehydrogenase / fumarate reductase cytochrome b subunit
MSWFIHYLTSSIGRKMIMSLTGLFLILFLVVHLLGNFQLLKNDGGVAFNQYTYFMTHFPLIKLISYGLYFFILLHTIQGLALWFANRKAKGVGYAVSPAQPGVTWASKNMALLGTLILAFLFIHMGDFWGKMKLGMLKQVSYSDFKNGLPIYDLYERVAIAFQNPIIVVIYVVGQAVLAFHLWHGFQSAFQTLGWNHPKYTPLVKFIGKAYSILVPLGFAIIPIWHFLSK